VSACYLVGFATAGQPARTGGCSTRSPHPEARRPAAEPFAGDGGHRGALLVESLWAVAPPSRFRAGGSTVGAPCTPGRGALGAPRTLDEASAKARNPQAATRSAARLGGP
jgi:hypothetical protein